MTLKEIGDPRDIATYFRLWDDSGCLMAKSIVTQCRQNTNYDIIRYAAHPFFLQGYTLCANGENTDFQKSLHRGYIGFESDSQNFIYTLHYVLRQLKWPINYFKHVITPLPFAEAEARDNKAVLQVIRQLLGHLEINGPNTIIAVLPSVGKQVIVIGAGNSGMDAEKVICIDVQKPAAFAKEIEHFHSLGGQIIWPIITQEITDKGFIADDGRFIARDMVIVTVTVGETPELDYLPDGVNKFKEWLVP